MMQGSSAAQLLSTIAAFGVSLCFATAASEARITQEAPSVICEELPAVTWPQGRSNTGLSFASVSAVESGRTPSSWSKNFPSREKAVSTSPFRKPSACACASRRWLSAA